MKNFIILSILSLVLLLLPITFFGQVSFSKVPLDKQLVPRDQNTNLGKVIISGKVDKTLTPYEFIQVDVFEDGKLFKDVSQSLSFNSKTANFNFKIKIHAKLSNYTFKIYGKTRSVRTLVRIIDDVVAGDVYIIQGQSNAVASKRKGSSKGNKNEFIRAFASGTESVPDLLRAHSHWYYGQGDGMSGTKGNVGQWGIKLARMIVDSKKIPVAIFNGAKGGAPLSYYKAPTDYQTSQHSNYGRLYYRLNKTGLLHAVRAIFWSQGENAGGYTTYKSEFLNLIKAWRFDYKNVENIYIFQSRNGCGSNMDHLQYVKEVQRNLAYKDAKIDIMTTEGLTQFFDNTNIYAYCHFIYKNGYEGFATRIFELVDRNHYNGPNSADISPPMVLEAYLSNATTLKIRTDAKLLHIDSAIDLSKYKLENGRSAAVRNIAVVGNRIVFTLTKYPGTKATISYIGVDPGVHSGLITNTNNIELVSFSKFPIADKIVVPVVSTWNGTSWSPSAPNSKMDAIIEGNYSANKGSFSAKNLIIKSGAKLNFNKHTKNSVIVFGDLTIDGTFILGDKESLLMYDDDAKIKGDLKKRESSPQQTNNKDLTYWSAPVTNEDIAGVFRGVRRNGIFYYDQSRSSAPWVVAKGKMIPGVGYAAEGPTGQTGVYQITFVGSPNNGIVSVPLIGNFRDNDPQNDFNLIGNPYPSGIDIDLFLKDNSRVIDPTIYFGSVSPSATGEDNNTSNYVAYNNLGGTTAGSKAGAAPHNKLGSSQGFFVRALRSGSVVFNNSIRVGEEDDDDKEDKSGTSKSVSAKTKDVKAKSISEKSNLVWLDLKTDRGGFNQILIGFTDKATSGIDKGYDALKMTLGNNPIAFYSIIENKKYIIQGLSQFSEDKTVRLGYKSNVYPRTLSIGINNMEGELKDAEIYLEDHLLGIIHELTKSDYEFSQKKAGDYSNRFTLKFSNNIISTLNTGDIENNNSISLMKVSNGYQVSSSKIIRMVRFYDTLGRMLYEVEPHEKEFHMSTERLRLGTVLLVELLMEDGSRVVKRTICY